MNHEEMITRVQRVGICKTEAQGSYESMMDGQAILSMLDEYERFVKKYGDEFNIEKR